MYNRIFTFMYYNISRWDVEARRVQCKLKKASDEAQHIFCVKTSQRSQMNGKQQR